MKPTTGLGKGLSAIFATEEQNTPALGAVSSQIELALVDANPSQPRTAFDAEALAELAASIARLGIIQPITVRATEGGRYQIVSGERRTRAARQAGLKTIPAYVREVGDDELLEMALVENVQREELDAIEIALSLQRLTAELGLTQEALSQSVGKRRSTVANYLRLLTLDEEVQAAVRAGKISMGHARTLVVVEGAERQRELLAEILKRDLSVRAAEALVKGPAPKRSAKAAAKVGLTDYTARLAEHLGTKGVKVESNERGAGKITLRFASKRELDELVARIEGK